MLRRRGVALGLAALVTTVVFASAHGVRRMATAATPLPTFSSRVELPAIAADAAAAVPEQKLHGGLRELAVTDPGSEVLVSVESLEQLDLRAFGPAHQFTWPAGEHVAVLQVRAGHLKKLAALPAVYAVRSLEAGSGPGLPNVPGLQSLAERNLSAATLRDRAQRAGGWSGTPLAAPPRLRPAADLADGAGPTGWWDVEHGHAAKEAWDLGFRGEGVTVAVLDDAVDFAHYDLMDTWAVLPDGHPYAGWPQVFDPEAGMLRAADRLPPEDRPQSTRLAMNGMIEAYQESEVSPRDVGGQQRPTACFQPLIFQTAQAPRVLAPETCDYIVPDTSQGGTVRFGHHPDGVLRGLGAREGQLGEWAGVLLVDETTAGVFETVYVDIDNDRDFSDEKPVTKASPLAWRDITEPADGVPDLAAGLLYWISDGVLPFPASWVWGLEADILPAGRFVGMLFIQGGHGTLCGSNILSQGRLGVPPDQLLGFRNLPGGQPASTNLGMAPMARLVSVGDVYLRAGAFAASWRYTIFGHELDRDDDNIQVTSNSYGWSGTDNDGLDPDSRFVDHYVRTFSPETTFLVATGNGAPGYGSIVPPSPVTGIDVAASTQVGSTGWDSITDTAQITYGDIIPFSNRGPGAGASTGPDVAADGAHASGGSPINGLGDGRRANGTWGGTSRATPVAAGALTLVYQAFRQRHDRWPTFEEARAILMSGARYAGYDTLTMGAGVVDAADAVRIAAGLGGIYATPGEWRAGGYRGQSHAAFPNVVVPGDETTAEILLTNPSAEPITLQLSAQRLRRVASKDDALVTNRSAESAPALVVPDYLKAIDKSWIPAGTDLLTVRGVYPMAEFDVNGDQIVDSLHRLGIMQHTDIDGDGLLWDDRNGNGVVNYVAFGDSYVDATVDNVTTRHDGTQGAITVPLDEDGLDGPLAWYGLGCNDENGVPPQPEQDIRERIALIERGTCTFAQKILNAQAFGAVGVVVFTDDRARVTMGGDAAGIQVSGVMIDRPNGLALRQDLLDGKAVTVHLGSRPITKGLDGGAMVAYGESEIDAFEYMRFSDDWYGVRNNWEVSVHHPLERWSDGMYVALWHAARSVAVTNTHVTFRYDAYQYQPWTALRLGQDEVTIPAGGQITVTAELDVPVGTPPGALVGAIFADYPRRDGDEPVPTPGGFERQDLRTVIPVIASVAANYAWQGTVTLGGAGARDADAGYDNGAVRGAFHWNWRPESGDWRFFFLDAAPPEDGTHWLFRTVWDDEAAGSDIDTRIWGPVRDRYSDPDHPLNQDEDWSAPDWYGPYTLGRVGGSPYLHRGGGVFAFNTSSGGNEDWVAAPAAEGLHEVMLHNVLFSGSQIDMPYESTAASMRISGNSVRLYADRCATVTLTSQLPMPGFTARGVGMAAPEVLVDQPVQQDDPNDILSTTYRHTTTLATDALSLQITLDGQDDDDLDLFLLRDNDADGQFTYPDELYAQAPNGPSADEAISLGATPAGAYQVWVHGFGVNGTDSTFDLTIFALAGDDLYAQDVPTEVPAGVPVAFQVCANIEQLAGQDGPASGRLYFGPSAAPNLVIMPVTWWRALPTIHLPLSLKLDVLGASPEAP